MKTFAMINHVMERLVLSTVIMTLVSGCITSPGAVYTRALIDSAPFANLIGAHDVLRRPLRIIPDSSGVPVDRDRIR